MCEQGCTVGLLKRYSEVLNVFETWNIEPKFPTVAWFHVCWPFTLLTKDRGYKRKLGRFLASTCVCARDDHQTVTIRMGSKETFQFSLTHHVQKIYDDMR